METTDSFESALMAVYAEHEAEGKLSLHDRRVFAKLKHHREHAIERIHRRVRDRYVAEGGIADTVKGIDWAKVKQWLKDHWPQIVQLILSIVFALI
jgi:hypothetical protein